MSAQNRVGCNDGRPIAKRLCAQNLAGNGQTSWFIVSEALPFALPAVLEDSVLQLDVCDDVLLPPVQPAENGSEQHLQTICETLLSSNLH